MKLKLYFPTKSAYFFTTFETTIFSKLINELKLKTISKENIINNEFYCTRMYYIIID